MRLGTAPSIDSAAGAETRPAPIPNSASAVVASAVLRLAGARAGAFIRRSPTTGDARPLEDLIE